MASGDSIYAAIHLFSNEKKKKRPLSYEGIIRDSRSDTVMLPCTLDLTHFLSFYDSAFTIPGFEFFKWNVKIHSEND